VLASLPTAHLTLKSRSLGPKGVPPICAALKVGINVSLPLSKKPQYGSGYL